MTARALLLDCDGVLTEVEQGGHLRAFNQVWAEEGVAWRWSPQEYRAATARTCGGHERLLALAESPAFRRRFGPVRDHASWHATTLRWHRRKTEILAEDLRRGGVTPRPGIRRLVAEARAAGWQVGIVSSGARPTVELIVDRVLGHDIRPDLVLVTGNDVGAKKPSPECYLLALERCRVRADDAVAVEDNANGLAAATGAGVPCLVTVTDDSAGHELASALAVVDCLGEAPGHPAAAIGGGAWQPPEGEVHLHDLVRLAAAHATGRDRTAVAAR